MGEVSGLFPKWGGTARAILGFSAGVVGVLFARQSTPHRFCSTSGSILRAATRPAKIPGLGGKSLFSAVSSILSLRKKQKTRPPKPFWKGTRCCKNRSKKIPRKLMKNFRGASHAPQIPWFFTKKRRGKFRTVDYFQGPSTVQQKKKTGGFPKGQIGQSLWLF